MSHNCVLHSQEICLCRFHEVVVSKQTLEAIERQKYVVFFSSFWLERAYIIHVLQYRAKKRPLWRVSSTMFAHIRSDVILKVLKQFEKEDILKQYPPTKAGDQVTEELKAIGLKVD
ncbi:hypothetical protein RFI_13092 [Reticulomyxa filosa]|uniref:Uncharacterized protein n=1 Tax=Reticulomyxa filosa TaxID=46433 RepID=X6NDU6_RETFI|nr:hypothetical protein RFI_13092 [Reticulomyxa filosa]|eukprot:ETO24068.1 hypothetical protein RFI_13092 [Reticulomyxa filosa]